MTNPLTRALPSPAMLVLACTATLGVSCATAEAPTATPGAAVIEALEQRILNHPALTIGFHITTEGAMVASVTGVCTLGPDDLAIHAHGTFGGQPLRVSMVSTTDKVLGHSSGQPIDVARGPELREAVVLGLTRMGLMHNIARLFSARAPDHQDGGVANWVEFDEARAEPNGDLTMDIRVAGAPAASATLMLDRYGLPLRRTQVVKFATGEMRVHEGYQILQGPQ